MLSPSTTTSPYGTSWGAGAATPPPSAAPSPPTLPSWRPPLANVHQTDAVVAENATAALGVHVGRQGRILENYITAGAVRMDRILASLEALQAELATSVASLEQEFTGSAATRVALEEKLQVIGQSVQAMDTTIKDLA